MSDETAYGADDAAPGKVSVWLGTSHKTLEEFSRYFEGLEELDSGSPIQLDFNCGFIDTDLFYSYGTDSGKIVSVEVLCGELSCSNSATVNNIIKATRKMGIIDGNSLMFYGNCTFTEKNPEMLYNELRFIGTFDD
ncbi:hypothetical protein [Deinococcus sp.]|uniref:hypothetical protein n=1 Tax=Deinococcus sp. TaxID=47478 RepID=UPI003B5CFAFC